MNKIVIRNLELFGHHGAYRQEQERGQYFWIDVELKGDFGAKDDLSETVDYGAVIEKIKQINSAKRFQLIESFAKAITEELVCEFSKVRRVKARVKKKPADLALGWVAAEETKECS